MTNFERIESILSQSIKEIETFELGSVLTEADKRDLKVTFSPIYSIDLEIKGYRILQIQKN